MADDIIDRVGNALNIGAEATKKVLTYLRYYGRLDTPLDDSPHFVAKVASELADFQATAGLPASGLATNDTIDAMDRPRCGCADVQRVGAFESKWRKKQLTYYTTPEGYVKGALSAADQDDLTAMAFGYWAEVADLKFTRAPKGTTPDLVISGGKGRGQQFDGPSGTLAYAYLPNGSDGQLMMRFDLDEKWVRTGSGIYYLNVASHEFGHMLGLDHSNKNGALMAPFYSQGISKPQQADDIPRIQSLYGPPVSSPPIPPIGPPPVIPPGETMIRIRVKGTYEILSN